MANQSSNLLASIGAIQTLVENFPMGILSSMNVKTYNSSLEFLMDALRTIGVNDKEIITFILEEIVGVNDLDYSAIDEASVKFQNNAFVQTLESAMKYLIAEILSNIISCSIWPTIPQNAISKGVDLPLSVLDPTNLMSVCPTSENGKKLYSYIIDGMTPFDMVTASTEDHQYTALTKDLNAAIWYAINMASPLDNINWGEICEYQNRGYKKVKIKIDESFAGKTLFEFNKKYLDSITIFSPKIILTNIIDELINGLPNVELNVGIDEIYNDAVFKKMIDTIVTSDDMGIQECYYTFSNEDWVRMLEDAELKKYNAKKRGDDTSSAAIIDKDSLYEALDKASADGTTMHDKLNIVGNAIYNAAKTQTIEYDALVDDGGVELRSSIKFEVNSAWLYNILSSIIRPIIKSAMTPKVMTLILVNYEIAGAMNLSALDSNAPLGTVLEFVKTKMLGVFGALIKRTNDLIIRAVFDFFNRKIAPLITKYATAKLLEQIQNYLDLLRQAMECIDLFGFPYMLGNGAKTDIDNVNYADITQTKNKPEQTIC